MVVAAGATGGESEERAGHGVDLFIDVVHEVADLEPLVHIFHTDGEEAGGHQLAGFFGDRTGGQQIPRDLLAEELVVGHVGSERGDHVVAVSPGVRVGEVAGRTGRFAIPRHVEPVPGPVLGMPG